MSVHTLVLLGMVGAFGIVVMNLVLMTQYFDMLKDIGASSRANAILIPHSPGNLASLTEQMRNAMIEADQVRVPEAASGSLSELRRAFDDGRTAPDAAQREIFAETV